MTTWVDLVKYVKSRYETYSDSESSIGITFSTRGGRRQVVLLSRQLLGVQRDEWVIMEAPIAQVDDVPLIDVLEEIGTIVCGGAALIHGTLTLRHAVGTDNLDLRAFEAPLILVVATADRLEAKYARRGTTRHEPRSEEASPDS